MKHLSPIPSSWRIPARRPTHARCLPLVVAQVPHIYVHCHAPSALVVEASVRSLFIDHSQS